MNILNFLYNFYKKKNWNMLMWYNKHFKIKNLVLYKI